jgi:LPXTG-motif cell wall-anchored protein
MMENLAFAVPKLPDTAKGAGGSWLALVAGVGLLALAFVAGRATSRR